MSTINIDTMVTAKLTHLGKAAIAGSGNGDLIGRGDTIRCPFGILMEVFGNAWHLLPGALLCPKEQNQLFVNNEIVIEDEPSPVEAEATATVDKGCDPCSNCLGVCEGCSHEPAEASPTPRYRITTNGEKFRIEELTKNYTGPWGTIRLVPIEEWKAVLLGTSADYDTRPEAEEAMAARITADEKAARPWVPVDEESSMGMQAPNPEARACARHVGPDCRWLVAAGRWWCSNQESSRRRGTTIAGVVECPHYEPVEGG